MVQWSRLRTLNPASGVRFSVVPTFLPAILCWKDYKYIKDTTSIGEYLRVIFECRLRGNEHQLVEC
jgi:hypothetical protein